MRTSVRDGRHSTGHGGLAGHPLSVCSLPGSAAAGQSGSFLLPCCCPLDQAKNCQVVESGEQIQVCADSNRHRILIEDTNYGLVSRSSGRGMYHDGLSACNFYPYCCFFLSSIYFLSSTPCANRVPQPVAKEISLNRGRTGTSSCYSCCRVDTQLWKPQSFTTVAQ